ncbi:hypothetical protein N7495_003261 [Penicillium taxi]|uniref:uncharacterized protein n=1 Tax=Penicillium taxi TaxID=168475 RepID=UPI0025454E4F|nr:uncharacterized protein N7495_003261 [Penicillium taxi]KAJ5902733.1 hypothetical protein N7495_003261 [Penicillium taxi]
MEFLAQCVDSALEAVSMDSIDALRTFFILGGATTIFVSIPTSLRSHFLLYGPRSTPIKDSEPQAGHDASSSGLLGYLASYQVPHSYFKHFYIFSVLSSLFWAFQLIRRGSFFEAIASRVSEEHQQQSISLTQVLICWILLFMQGSRRVWESYEFAKPSSSQMWVVHWLLGFAFYLAAGVAIWIDGSGALTTQNLTLSDLQLTNAPSLRTLIFVPLFLIASGLQHDCHHFLFSLKKYQIPDHPLFRGAVCPHYGAECVIYLSLAFIAAPPGQAANKTLLACVGFIAANLGATALTTKQWYIQKFGKDSVQGRWLMIPGIY